MLFPQYYFFAERRLMNHTIKTVLAEDLDQCELLCYLNDDCVSLNIKKDPNNGGHKCELNNSTHLEHDIDLITDAVFYYRGSKVSNNSNIYSSRHQMINKQIHVTMNNDERAHEIYSSAHSFVSSFFRFFVCSVVCLFVCSFIRSFFVSLFIRSFLRSFVHYFVSSFVRSLFRSFVRLFVHSFPRSSFISFVSSIIHLF